MNELTLLSHRLQTYCGVEGELGVVGDDGLDGAEGVAVSVEAISLMT
jgi:hypothetical protein